MAPFFQTMAAQDKKKMLTEKFHADIQSKWPKIATNDINTKKVKTAKITHLDPNLELGLLKLEGLIVLFSYHRVCLPPSLMLKGYGVDNTTRGLETMSFVKMGEKLKFVMSKDVNQVLNVLKNCPTICRFTTHPYLVATRCATLAWHPTLPQSAANIASQSINRYVKVELGRIRNYDHRTGLVEVNQKVVYFRRNICYFFGQSLEFCNLKDFLLPNFEVRVLYKAQKADKFVATELCLGGISLIKDGLPLNNPALYRYFANVNYKVNIDNVFGLLRREEVGEQEQDDHMTKKEEASLRCQRLVSKIMDCPHSTDPNIFSLLETKEDFHLANYLSKSLNNAMVGYGRQMSARDQAIKPQTECIHPQPSQSPLGKTREVRQELNSSSNNFQNATAKGATSASHKRSHSEDGKENDLNLNLVVESSAKKLKTSENFVTIKTESDQDTFDLTMLKQE